VPGGKKGKEGSAGREHLRSFIQISRFSGSDFRNLQEVPPLLKYPFVYWGQPASAGNRRFYNTETAWKKGGGRMPKKKAISRQKAVPQKKGPKGKGRLAEGGGIC